MELIFSPSMSARVDCLSELQNEFEEGVSAEFAVDFVGDPKSAPLIERYDFGPM